MYCLVIFNGFDVSNDVRVAQLRENRDFSLKVLFLLLIEQLVLFVYFDGHLLSCFLVRRQLDGGI